MNEADKWLMGWNYTPLGREMENLMKKLDKEEDDLEIIKLKKGGKNGSSEES